MPQVKIDHSFHYIVNCTIVILTIYRSDISKDLVVYAKETGISLLTHADPKGACFDRLLLRSQHSGMHFIIQRIYLSVARRGAWVWIIQPDDVSTSKIETPR